MENYALFLFYDDRDNIWIADIPDLEGCSAHGSTPQKALKEVLLAKQYLLEAYRESNRPLPKRSYDPRASVGMLPEQVRALFDATKKDPDKVNSYPNTEELREAVKLAK